MGRMKALFLSCLISIDIASGAPQFADFYATLDAFLSGNPISASSDTVATSAQPSTAIRTEAPGQNAPAQIDPFDLSNVNTWDNLPASLFNAPSPPPHQPPPRQIPPQHSPTHYSPTHHSPTLQDSAPISHHDTMSQKSTWNDHSPFDQEQSRRRWDYSMNGLDQGSPMGIDSGNMVGGASQGSQQEPFLPLADHSPGSSMADNPGQVLDWSSPPVSKDTYKYEDEPAPKPQPADAEAMAKAVLRGQVKRWEWTYSSTLLNGEISSRYRDDSQSSVFCCQRLPYICNVDGVCVIDRKECQEFCSCASNPYTPHCTKDVIPRIKKRMTALEDKILEKVSKELNLPTPPTLVTTSLPADPTTTEFIYVRRSTYRPATSNRSLTIARGTPTPLSNYDATSTLTLRNNDGDKPTESIPPQRQPSVKSTSTTTTTPRPTFARSTTTRSQPKTSSSVSPTKSSTALRTTQGSTSSRTTQGSTSSRSTALRTTQGSTSGRSTQGSTSSRTTQGSTSSRTTQGSTSSRSTALRTTQGSTSGRSTQGSTSGRSTQGSTSSRTTQGSTSSHTNQGSTSSRTTQDSTLNQTTQGSTSNRTTQDSTSNHTTQGSTSSRAIQGRNRTSSSNLFRTSIQMISTAPTPSPRTTIASSTVKESTTPPPTTMNNEVYSTNNHNAFSNGAIRGTASSPTQDNNDNNGTLHTLPTISTITNSTVQSSLLPAHNASTISSQYPIINTYTGIDIKTSTSIPSTSKTSESHTTQNISTIHASTIRNDPVTSTSGLLTTPTSHATVKNIVSTSEPLTTFSSDNSTEISTQTQSPSTNYKQTDSVKWQTTTTNETTSSSSEGTTSSSRAASETAERSFGNDHSYGNLSYLMVSTTSVGDGVNRTVLWSDVPPVPTPSQDESDLVVGGKEREFMKWLNPNVETDPCNHFPCENGSCSRLGNGVYICNCSEGWTGDLCDMPCNLDCGQHGHCGRVGKNMTGCICHQNYTGRRCEEKKKYVPGVTEVSTNMNNLKVWEVALIAIMTAVCAATVFVAMPYLLWRRQWIPIRQLVFYFQEYEEDDDKDYDAFVSYQSSPRDERFILQHLYPKLEKELQFRLCLHFRDFSPGEPIANNIISAVERSRRTIMILSPSYVASEWCRMEYQKAQHEMLRLKHKIIPIILEDIDGMPEMDANLKTIIDTVTYIKWPGEEEPSTSKKVERFWKLLELSMPKKKETLARSLSTCSSDMPLTSITKSCFDSIASSLKDFDELSATSLSSSSSAFSNGSSSTTSNSTVDREESAPSGSRAQSINEAKVSHVGFVTDSISAPGKKETSSAEDCSVTKSIRSSGINSEQSQLSSNHSAVSSRTKQLPFEHSLTPPPTSIAPRKNSLPSSATSSIPVEADSAQESRRTSDQSCASSLDNKVIGPALLGASCPAVKQSPAPRFSSDDYIIEVKEIGKQIKISNRPPRKYASELLV
ncbi:hypothetical protein Btru_057056 [Bulinus truncatus]|nr:hypothetical protein Btru_057056 [Bulinus truncatus]